MELRELIHADADFHELGVVDFIKFDGMISGEPDLEENDWELEIPAGDFERYHFQTGDYVYFPNTEWGGCVEKFVHVSSRGVIKVCGVTWRGMLIRKVISPPAGQSHLVFDSVEAGDIMAALTEPFEGLFEVGESEGGAEHLICEKKKFRYQNVLEGITDMLADLDCRLELALDPDGRKVVLYVQKITDHSEEIEFSGDYDLSYTSTRAEAQYNHVIALGQGEQENRTVKHLWLLPDGSVTNDANAEGIAVGFAERTVVYDYPNCEDEDELISGAKKRLLKYGAQNEIEFNFDSFDIDLPLGDKVGIRDRMTEMEGVKTIAEKLLTVSADGTLLKYSVE